MTGGSGYPCEQGVVSVLPQGQFPWLGGTGRRGLGRRTHPGERLRGTAGRWTCSRERPGVDPPRIALVGHDFGAMHGVVLAAEDERIAGDGLIAATPRWADWFLTFWPNCPTIGTTTCALWRH